MGAALSKALVAGEKVSLCFTCTALICCLMFTLLTMLGLGIGLGYNHCFIDMKTRNRYVPAHYKYQDSPRWVNARETQWLRQMAENDELNQMLEPEMRDDNMIGPVTPRAGRLTNLTNVTSSFINNMTSNEESSVLITNTDIVLKSSTIIDIEPNNNLDTVFKISEEESQNSTNKEIIPITGLNFLDLISKLKENNEKYSIQIIRN